MIMNYTSPDTYKDYLVDFRFLHIRLRILTVDVIFFCFGLAPSINITGREMLGNASNTNMEISIVEGEVGGERGLWFKKAILTITNERKL